MADETAVHDPLTINLHRQTQALLDNLSLESPQRKLLQNASSRIGLLNTLSRLLSTPGYTLLTAKLFRPLLLDLCARWLDDGANWEDKFEAFGFLLEIYPSLYPVFSKFISCDLLQSGPLSFLANTSSVVSTDACQLHRLLLAYYRILQANRDLPNLSKWSLKSLARLIWEPHPDPGVRYLAVRCYALQAGMMEADRIKLENEAIGDMKEVDCPIFYDAEPNGTRAVLDGWLVPTIEADRVFNERQALLNPQKYYTYEEGDSVEPIHPAELSSLIANVHGVLMMRSSATASRDSHLVSTPTASKALRNLALHLSLNVPTLLTSAPSSGKSLLLTHLASVLYPDRANQIVTIHLADTSLDPRSLLGSYVSSPTRPGTFEWKDGVLVRAMREGRWIVFEDIDKGSSEVLGLIKPLVESLGLNKWIGGQAEMDVASRGHVRAVEGFSIFATRSMQPSRNGNFPPPVFFGAHKFHEVIVDAPTRDDLCTIVNTRFPRLAGAAGRALIRLWEAVRDLGSTASTRDTGVRELEKLCLRVDRILPSSHQPMDMDTELGAEVPPLASIFPNPTIREDIFLDCRDVFFGAGATTTAARAHFDSIAAVIAEHLGLSPEQRDWVLSGRTPDFTLDKDANGNIVSVYAGRTRLAAVPLKTGHMLPPSRSFAMHKPAISLLSRIASAIALQEPVLLTGETGTGKTSVVTHLASLLRKPLISLNLSNQTESSDIVGGFKPVDARVPASELQERFLELFGGTFSRKKNTHFEESVRKAVQESKWKRAVALWLESVRLARERIQARLSETTDQAAEAQAPRKRRKTDANALNIPESSWIDFERDVRTFEIQHIQGNGKFAFSFVEGPLVKALRLGHWILLDEVNLASPETLECVSSLLHGPTASITLTEQGSLEPVPRHPDFRLFACMNPATDVGKKDLPPNIRTRFTEIDVPPPDADKETLVSIVSHYIGAYAVGDKGAIMDVAEFYTGIRTLAERREIADGSNHKPHFSMRTLSRALTFTADLASTYSLRRALWEGCLMAFTMVLDDASATKVTALAQRHILAGVKNMRSLLTKEPSPPQGRSPDDFVKFGPFYLEKGPLPEDLMDEYIMTPSVETKLIDLARIILTRRFPVLIEGPTSSGKTSSIEYLARRTGHRFVRINNHEHTDIQEYLGTYVSDPTTGKLVFKDGLLVRALRNGDWIVLDELNLAPTDVLEALNRLLDDNRELVIPETQEVVKPHPHFMLFATQNPPGLYAGRKVLSRAFRNRFLEVHFEDVPQSELETILCQRCRIAPSYGQRIVAVFQELQKRRQSSRIFESKHGFATLRDLFRWAGRDAIDYQELADNGYMLLAERARRDDDKNVVKDVIESVMKVSIDPSRLYSLQNPHIDLSAYLGCPIPDSPRLVWTSAMQRLFTLLARALRFNEPVLLVGETGCGKTSVCQLFAEITGRALYAVNCHQNTETADLIGSTRPLRNRLSLESEAIQKAMTLLASMGHPHQYASAPALTVIIDNLLRASESNSDHYRDLSDVSSKLHRLTALFEWHNGPLIEAMLGGDVFLMDEISLADDSVLERLNSVLETGRTIVLAEQGGTQDIPSVKAHDQFKLVATMNPGGDYGKKELSPALRNRFTEIWVPAVDIRSDLEMIIRSSWRHEAAHESTGHVLDFTNWLTTRIGDSTLVTLRDLLAWVEFVNATFCPEHAHVLPLNAVIHHAAYMTFLDGLGSLPQLATFSISALETLRTEAVSKLEELFPLPANYSDELIAQDPSNIQLGSFSIPRGPLQSNPSLFSFQAPTTRDNVNRVVRACQLTKPILLEGSPGVGKTSLVSALANICGHHLCRINLSDQTDLMDLFGSDLPVEGGAPGQFAWKDAEFLRALQQGHWVLLDEMNLAPQAVLEGLNAVLDHRGTVYIPELGRSFVRHPSFRIFAAQNPLHQGGGRKGLPKSFLNRFTKVHVQELSSNDVLVVCRTLFPQIPLDVLQAMVKYTTRLNEELVTNRSFARDGAPWEFNLRDIIRWGSLMKHYDPSTSHPAAYVDALFLQRFRTESDRNVAHKLFTTIFTDGYEDPTANPQLTVSPKWAQIGISAVSRHGIVRGKRPGCLLQSHLRALRALSICLESGWLTILTGPPNSGKNSIVRLMAQLTGHVVHEISINSATDASDILGSFEEIDSHGRRLKALNSIALILDQMTNSVRGSALAGTLELIELINVALSKWSEELFDDIKHKVNALEVTSLDDRSVQILQQALNALSTASSEAGRFEWVDGPLVSALKEGSWVILDGANLCNPSVLDRLNSLCENDGVLTLNERGAVGDEVETIKPHATFRMFMCVDSHLGELSRAMRNRGVEVALMHSIGLEDSRRALHHLRIPSTTESSGSSTKESSVMAILLEKGINSGCVDHVELDTAPCARLLGTDTLSATLLDFSALLQPSYLSRSQQPLSYVITHHMPPPVLPLFTRLMYHQSLSSDTYTGIFTLLQELSRSHVMHEALRIRTTPTAHDRLGISLYQPFDLNILPSGQNDKPSLVTLTILLQLFVRLSASGQLITLRSVPQKSDTQARIKSAVSRLLVTMLTGIRKHCDDVDISDGHAQADLQFATRLLSYGLYLYTVTTLDRVDHSATLVIARWLVNCFQQAQPTFEDVAILVHAFNESVALTTGLGISELWAGLTSHVVPDIVRPQIARLDALSTVLPTSMLNMRTRIFELMTLLSLPGTIADADRKAMNSLTDTVEMQLQSIIRQETQDDTARDVRIGYLVGELDAISSLDVLRDQPMSNDCVKNINELLNITMLDPKASLSRMMYYQHALWAHKADQPSIPNLIPIQKQWLEAVWETPTQGSRSGPSVLLGPALLVSVLSSCGPDDVSLDTLANHEAELTRQLRMVILNASASSPRLTQLGVLLGQCLLMIAACFRSTFEDNTYAQLENLSSRISRPVTAVGVLLKETVSTIALSQHLALRSAIEIHFQPLLHGPSSFESFASDIQGLGNLWIALSRVILDLYVPDKPIDPASLQHCANTFWEQERSILSSQITLFKEVALRTSGNESNGTIAYLEHMAQQASCGIADASTVVSTSRSDLSRLYTYWAEVQQFLKQVVSPQKTDAYLAAAQTLDPSVAMREGVVQASISAFSQRLHTMYAEFGDVNAPLQFSLFAMKLGLRLSMDATNSTTHPESAALLKELTAFPSVIGAQMQQDTPRGHGSFGELLTQLAAVAFDVSLGGPDRLHHRIRDITDLYERAIGLWSIDRSRSEDQIRKSASLYRRKNDDGNSNEAEEEEEEFLAMFPEFGDLLEPSGDESGSSHKDPVLVEAASAFTLFDIHQQMFLEPYNVSIASWRFLERRRHSVRFLVDSSLSFLPESLDRHSVAFQLNLMDDKLASLRSPLLPSQRTYDFYLHDNVPEIRNAIEVVASLIDRLNALIAQWPDQMVLHHLKSRCEVVMRFSFYSSVAKMLSALEQLLSNIEDWEMYANRDNSLRAHQQNMIALIVRWRRMELTSWQGLLDGQAKAFMASTSEWWFRLYDASIRGLENACATELESDKIISEFLDELVPLLDDFVATSPIGQFQARLRLLQSMENYADHLARTRDDVLSRNLMRLRRVLCTTRQYYDQFSGKVSKSLSDQRAILEKEINGYIKLASWKDVNVHALKQSAQKTHRQLYKIIRKFRDVLRRPVAPFFQSPSSSILLMPKMTSVEFEDEQISLTANSVLPTFPSLPNAPANAPHLLHLGRTFGTFQTHIRQRMGPKLSAFTPRAVNDLTREVMTSSQALASAAVPPGLVGERRTKFLKNLLTRKKKTWSDFTKEFKKAGVSFNVKPEVLQQNHSQRWVREQSVLPKTAEKYPSIVGAEEYRHRLHAILPGLRASLSNHHPDISTRELLRASSQVESILSFAMQTRDSLAQAMFHFEKLESNYRRLQQVATSPVIVAAGINAQTLALSTRDTVHKTVHALQECTQQARNIQSHAPSFDVSSAALNQIEELASDLVSTQVALDDVCDAVTSTDYVLLLTGESDVIHSALACLKRTENCLYELMQDSPHMQAFIEPLITWLRSKKPDLTIHLPPQTSSDPKDEVIDGILLAMQGLLAIHDPEVQEEEEEAQDNFIKDNYRAIQALTKRLSLDGISHRLEDLLARLAGASRFNVELALARLMPFLDLYMSLATAQIINHGNWTRALFKLGYITSSVVRSVSLDGFCQPQESEEADGNAAGTEQAEGAGLGEGTGNENVSKDIQDESQVEGLQGEESQGDDKVERAEEGNAIEMSEDFGGEMQDVEDDGEEENEGESDDESDEGPEERHEELDAGDEGAIDEKLWGDEQGPKDQEDAGKSNQDHSTQQQGGESELTAKEGEQKKADAKQEPSQDQHDQSDAPLQEGEDGVMDEKQDEEPVGSDGAPLDDHIPEADTLDLPESMELDSAHDQDQDLSGDVDDDLGDEDEEMQDGAPDDDARNSDAMSDIDEGAITQTMQDEGQHEPETEGEQDSAIAQADTHAGDGSGNGEQSRASDPTQAKPDDPTEPDSSPKGQTGHTQGISNKVQENDPHELDDTSRSQEEATAVPVVEAVGETTSAGDATGAQQLGPQSSSQAQPQSQLPNPLRSLGDTLREISQRVNEILENDGSSKDADQSGKDNAVQVEYAHPEDSQQDMQALGPARQDEVTKLRELNLQDEETDAMDVAAPELVDMIDDSDTNAPSKLPELSSLQAQTTTESLDEKVDSALTPADIRSRQPASTISSDQPTLPLTEFLPGDRGELEEAMELEIKQWQARGQPSIEAENIWRRYESLTHDLSYALCEQLRLILEPTLATRLKGDYRTGKRLNMKKIIPYIASEYTKDKIWLRRTRPSQREYQVLIALDDSRSMAESHSIHLAFQTLALVSKALGRLEVGDVAIARFGQSVDILHGFEGGPFTDQAGTKIMDAFHFDQKATNVLSLLETSLTILEQARERRSTSSSSAADLWQMEIIISDGICQDHEKLRTILRRAEEQRVMVVFIILDSLHSATAPSSSASAASRAANQNSVLSMNQVAYKNVNGRMELTVSRYLDSFPFEYYVVVRDVEALPEVLSGTLKQFFERISEE